MLRNLIIRTTPLFALCITMVSCAGDSLEKLSLEFEQASVYTKGNEIIIETGEARGQWQWTGQGFVTSGFSNLTTGKEWIDAVPQYPADWDLQYFGGDNATAILKNLSARQSDDEGFTSPSIEVIAEIDYPDASLSVQYVVRAYPNAPGFRTQLFVKGMPGFEAPEPSEVEPARIDYLPVSFNGMIRLAAGYFNNHDSRNADSLEVMREVIAAEPLANRETYDWASLLLGYDETGGVGIVKESHKVVNLSGVNTGAFDCDASGLVSTGWGLTLADVHNDKYRPCWASWRLLWDGGADNRELAVKRFDRLRYPIDYEYDMFMMTNVWGGGKGSASANEENILKEIESCADFGIDVLQIDAGWGTSETPNPWDPSPEKYPQGWSNIMKSAKEHGITMGIWNRAYDTIKYPNLLIGHFDNGFRYYKVDLYGWDTYNKLDSIVTNARLMLQHGQHTARINWDVTHKLIRVGYFYAREYGNLFLQNRRLAMTKDKSPLKGLYVPRRMLRDSWQISKYVNLNQVMFNVQNTDLVNREVSNAYKYGNLYSFAISMMSSPLFFQETWRYKPEVREPLRNLITLYKKHRREIYGGYVFPIGDKPDDTKWTGFQSYNPEQQTGYLTVFREIDNESPTASMALRFLANKKIKLENLIDEASSTANIDAAGNLEFQIDRPASFQFYRYAVMD
jgi:hypothetical protein